MKHYLLRIAYDGTAYAGWQVQRNAVSIAGTIEERFLRVFGVPGQLLGASRTDAGVHAYDQVAVLRTALTIPASRLHTALQASLPRDLSIRTCVDAPDGFHPQYNVLFKEYWYHLFLQQPLPFFARFGVVLPEYMQGFDSALFARTLALFEGTHNFSSFARVDEGYEPVRSVQSIQVVPLARYGVLRVVVRAEGFLRYQVRRMVGAGLMVARTQSSITLDDIAGFLRIPQQTSPAFFTAPPEGLCLRRIVYKKEIV